MAVDRLREHATGIVMIMAVPAVLVSVYLLPHSTRLALVLPYESPTLAAAYSMHFVHLESGHLLGNLAVYLLVVPTAYLLAVRGRRLDVFWTAFATFLLGLPFVLSWLNVALARPRVGFGFSGINMAFVGLLALMLVAAAGRERSAGLQNAPGLFFVGIGIIAALAVPTPTIRVVLVALATVVVMLYVVDASRHTSVRSGLRSVARSEGVEYLVAGLVVFTLVPVAAFPSSPAAAGRVLNLYTHLLGYCLGFIAPYSMVSILGTDRSGSIGRPDAPGGEVPLDAD